MHKQRPTPPGFLVSDALVVAAAPGCCLVASLLLIAGRREAMPEALDMCDNFTALRELQLFSPLEDVPLEEVQVCAAVAGQHSGRAALDVDHAAAEQ